MDAPRGRWPVEREIEWMWEEIHALGRKARENDHRAYIRDLVLAGMLLAIGGSQLALLLIVRGMR